MKKLSINMSHPNYIRIANTHIFFDFSRDNLDYLLELPKGSIKKIHVFVTTHRSINPALNDLIKEYKVNPDDTINKNISLSVHIPIAIKDVAGLFRNYIVYKNIPNLLNVDKCDHGFNGGDQCVRIRNGKKSLKVEIVQRNRCYTGLKIQFPEYFFIKESDEQAGIFDDVNMRIDPKMFKEKLIEAFKQKAGVIAKSFKSDEDIWDYINKQGVWNVK